ncbi:signal transduction histidine kinase [Streptomyces sp. Amel2xB2]|uniref:sensor histidine kinase n=1 Tax=Streptomyces sp. Amel2xB2 TaxID=1305829 RepID=UPI000DBA589D|nr:nitrate- and nitrite sensing domain-containing protein [Streptomyces sp. Amel2xB2]RAJ63423.1 signal transduction histidine kinase [Streptomyces sp. Amel2xB2]
MRRSKTGAATPGRAESRGNFTPPSRASVTSDLPDTPGDPGSRLAVRNWRVRTRLYAILLIPVAVGLVFGGFRVSDSVGTWNEAEDAQRTAELVRAAATYGNALIDERDRSAEPLLSGRRNDPAVERARNATDRAKREFDRAASAMPDKPGLERRLALFRKVEPELGTLRAGAYSERLGGVETEERYVAVQHPLMEFANELGFGTGNVTSYGRTVYSVSLGKAAQSLERSIGMHLLVRPGPGKADTKRQYTALTSYAYLERIALEEYVGGGRPSDVKLLKQEQAKAEAKGKQRLAKAKAAATAAGKDFVPPPSTKKAIPLIVSGADKRALAAKGITPQSWFATTTGTFDAYRAVEKELTERAVDETAQISDDAARDALVNAVIVLVALLIAFFLAGMMARSMSRSMGSLRAAAFDVAQQRLPMLVDQLSRTDPGRVDTRVAPIPIDSTDEIGEVARAFDQVHREAVRLAAEQALLRGNVSAIFTNLSSRNQGLIERQLGLISDLENNEADPDQLESLFRLDHLATRMRRNGENLLVLAGEEPGRSWNEPVPLVDILRAASSEVEHYDRIELSGIPEVEIHGQVVNDLVHLLAELLENATSFSSPQTKVDVTATRLPDERVVIEIHDKGVGLTAEDFADINHKLANPPTVDAALARRMGLYVVGRLADRHGIRVQLRPSGQQVGTTCLVMLPAGITQGGGGEDEGYEDFTVSRIAPEPPAPSVPAPQSGPPSYGRGLPPSPTAAELGFDDGRYDVPDDLSSLGPLTPGARPQLGDGRREAPDLRRGELEQGQIPGQDRGQGRGRQHDAGQGRFEDQDRYQLRYGPYQDRYEEQEPGQEPEQEPEWRGEPWRGPDHGAGQVLGTGGPVHGQQPPQAPQPPQSPYEPHTPQGPQRPYGHGAFGGPEPGPAGPTRSAGPEEPDVRNAPDAFGQQPAPSAQPFSPFGSGPPRGAQLPQQGGQLPFRDVDRSSQSTEAESGTGVHETGGDRVGFDRPGPAPSSYRTTTGAGLPRREAGRSRQDGEPAEQHQQHQPQAEPAEGSGQWRNANDESWSRAGQVRDPQSSGLTPSGLPRRVPRANLVAGTAEANPRGGPSVSRAPEDVRGRLSNLHRGVRRGRGTGDASQNDREGFGPGSTYDQER